MSLRLKRFLRLCIYLLVFAVFFGQLPYEGYPLLWMGQDMMFAAVLLAFLEIGIRNLENKPEPNEDVPDCDNCDRMEDREPRYNEGND